MSKAESIKMFFGKLRESHPRVWSMVFVSVVSVVLVSIGPVELMMRFVSLWLRQTKDNAKQVVREYKTFWCFMFKTAATAWHESPRGKSDEYDPQI